MGRARVPLTEKLVMAPLVTASPVPMIEIAPTRFRVRW